MGSFRNAYYRSQVSSGTIKALRIQASISGFTHHELWTRGRIDIKAVVGHNKHFKFGRMSQTSDERNLLCPSPSGWSVDKFDLGSGSMSYVRKTSFSKSYHCEPISYTLTAVQKPKPLSGIGATSQIA